MAKAKKKPESMGLPFGPINYGLMGLALLVIIIGYISLGSGSITLAPILLVLGYCVLFPIGLIYGGSKKDAASLEEEH